MNHTTPHDNNAATFHPLQFMINSAMNDLQPFMGKSQLAAIRQGAKGEESEYFITRMVELAALIHSMPKTYEQTGMQSIAYLHYFTPSADFYITEKDIYPDQVQAFGLADIFQDGGELGYISIPDLLKNGAELDLHFTPQPLIDIK